ncbi:hypothetical protein AB0I10_40955 [Streptomyces sp. NPDC050636]|uniref:hypothetical protein n=1 Tax=Streptomyces sp. NPDC050636 TaxID=3154510 RepID=UPI003436AA83
MAATFGPESDGELTYAGCLLSVLDGAMLLLADAGFDANVFARDVQATGAQFLVRSSARRIPTPFRHLGDGSYLARIGYGVLPVLQTTTADTVTTATGILPPAGPVELDGTIGRAVRPRRPAPRPPQAPAPAPLQGSHPQEPHQQVRTERRTPPATNSQNYAVHATVTFFEHGLSNRSRT